MDIATTLFPVMVIAQTWHNNVFVAALAVGICFHLLVARPAVEFEQSMRQFFSVSGFFSVVYLGASVFIANQSAINGVTQLISSWAGFSLGVYLSLTVYRLIFHRCGIFPGPIVARLTRFYAAYLNGQKAQFYERLRGMHAVYGDFLRIGRSFDLLISAALIFVFRTPRTQHS
jgi:energy-converting hydrogenase Eha subunit A